MVGVLVDIDVDLLVGPVHHGTAAVVDPSGVVRGPGEAGGGPGGRRREERGATMAAAGGAAPPAHAVGRRRGRGRGLTAVEVGPHAGLAR